jgi:hypothetical protein
MQKNCHHNLLAHILPLPTTDMHQHNQGSPEKCAVLFNINISERKNTTGDNPCKGKKQFTFISFSRKGTALSYSRNSTSVTAAPYWAFKKNM